MDEVFAHHELRALLSDIAGREVAVDWLIEHRVPDFTAMEAIRPPTQSQFLPAHYYGIGRGRGSGSGRGRGSESGIGRGIWRGSGIGSGRGRGSGIGSGRGRGSGIGSGRGISQELFMNPGEAWLVLTVDWYAWVGRVVRQVGPWEYEMEYVSKFDTNAGDVFGEIAAGDADLRRGATYQHFGGKPILGQGAVGKIPWVGTTPGEEKAKHKDDQEKYWR